VHRTRTMSLSPKQRTAGAISGGDLEIAHHEVAVGGMIRRDPIVIDKSLRRSHPLTTGLSDTTSAKREKSKKECRNVDVGEVGPRISYNRSTQRPSRDRTIATPAHVT
jgi:hypothetical protein